MTSEKSELTLFLTIVGVIVGLLGFVLATLAARIGAIEARADGWTALDSTRALGIEQRLTRIEVQLTQLNRRLAHSDR